MTCLLMSTIISVDYSVQILMRFFGQTLFRYLIAASIMAELNSIVYMHIQKFLETSGCICHRTGCI